MASPCNLINIPLELFLLIIGAGPLDIPDVFALRHTCRLIYDWSFDHSFWTAVITAAGKVGASLPLPSFRSLQDVSSEDLAHICLRYWRSARNLAHPTPMFRTYHTITFPQQPTVAHVATLPGGRYMLFLHSDGVLEMWDKGVFEASDVWPPPPDCREGEPVGQSLGRFETGILDPFMEFTTRGNTGTIIDVVITSDNEDPMTVFIVVKIVFNLDETVSFERSSVTNVPAVFVERFGLYTGLLVCVWKNGETLQLGVVDYQKDVMVIVETTVSVEGARAKDIDVLVTTDGTLLVYTYGADIEVYVYYDAHSLIPPEASTTFVPLRMVPPSTRMSFLGPSEWRTRHVHHQQAWYCLLRPYNTPGVHTHGLVPLIADAFNPVTTERLAIEAQLLDVDMILEQMKAGTSGDHVLPRTIYDHDKLFIGRQSRLSPGGAATYCMGNCGRNHVWAEKKKYGGGDLMLLPLQPYDPHSPPSSPSELSPASARRLKWPMHEVDLSEVLSMDWCDTSSTLALVTSLDGCQTIHLFEY